MQLTLEGCFDLNSILMLSDMSLELIHEGVHAA